MDSRPQWTSPDQPQRIAIYTRISADNSGRAVGVVDQAARCREMIARRWPGAEILGPGCRCNECIRDGTPLDVYCDNDLSALSQKRRPHYERLLAEIEAGKIDAVVAMHTDRLHRHTTELDRYIDICEPNSAVGARFDGAARSVPTYTVLGGQLDLTTSNGRGVARMLGVVARMELEHMIERQLARKLDMRERGAWTGGPRPFGYRLLAHTHEGKGLAILEDEAAFVRQAYADLLAGMPLSAIARKLNAAGVRTAATRGSGIWTNSSVRIALLRPVNAALIEYPRGTLVGRGTWEPIIDEGTFLAARALLASETRRTSPGPKPRSLLTGVLVCGKCGSQRFTVARRSGSRDKSGLEDYRCTAAQDPHSAVSSYHLSRAAGPLDEYVTTEIQGILGDESALSALAARPAADIGELRSRQTGLRARLDELAALFAAGDIDAMQLSAGSKPLRTAIGEAEEQLTDALTAPGLEDFTDGRDPVQVWEGLSIERKRAVAGKLLRVLLLPQGRGNRSRGGRKGSKAPLSVNPVYVVILPPDDARLPEWWASSVKPDRRREIVSLLPADRDFLKELTV